MGDIFSFFIYHRASAYDRPLDPDFSVRVIAYEKTALHSGIDYFFGPELGLNKIRSPSQRSILEHLPICPPSQFARLHGNHTDDFFGPELKRNRT